MSAAAATSRPSPRTPFTSHSHQRPQKRPSTTPLGLPIRTPGSADQAVPPPISPKSRSPTQNHYPAVTSPSYFGFATEPGNAVQDPHAGNASKSQIGSSPVVFASNRSALSKQSSNNGQSLEAFRKQAESTPFSLDHGSFSHFSDKGGEGILGGPGKPHLSGSGDSLPKDKPLMSRSLGNQKSSLDQDAMDVDSASSIAGNTAPVDGVEGESVVDRSFRDSPASVPLRDPPMLRRSRLSQTDEKHPRLSLPGIRSGTPPLGSSLLHRIQRSETLPDSVVEDGPNMTTSQDVVELIKSLLPQDYLLLDLRVFPQYSQSRIFGALNLCIPTTLLKRPSFNVQKLAATFTEAEEKAKFASWRETKHIILYDVNSIQVKDATSSVNTLKKFLNEGWQGQSHIIRGGFQEVIRSYPDMIDARPSSEINGTSAKKLSIGPIGPGAAPVAGGCPMPATKAVANPFFGNIRQNMDLIGGVGQMTVKHPMALTKQAELELPKWIQQAADNADNGKMVAGRFLGIEKAEQQRMQKALSGNVSYGTPSPTSRRSVQVAGIEKGAKNRYKDILPFDHSRVRLKDVPTGECDYVNASYVQAEWSNKHYIASQAPIPATFPDFWRMIWEHDVRVIIMLTAEHEGGQRKSHPYWDPGSHGSVIVEAMHEKRVSLGSSSNDTEENHDKRPSGARRRSTNPILALGEHIDEDVSKISSPQEPPTVIIRTLRISRPSQSPGKTREIVQVQYSSWPDFGAPAHPAHVLALVEFCSRMVQTSGENGSVWDQEEPEPPNQRPVVVHCSAGCGRTGTFCTVDSVLDMIKRQHQRVRNQFFGPSQQAREGKETPMDLDSEEGKEGAWTRRDDVDLVAKVVEDFRSQRLSMVQTLRQFVLCYETVMEWMVRELPDRAKRGGSARRSC